jgi:hypothetical protein
MSVTKAMTPAELSSLEWNSLQLVAILFVALPIRFLRWE